MPVWTTVSSAGPRTLDLGPNVLSAPKLKAMTTRVRLLSGNPLQLMVFLLVCP